MEHKYKIEKGVHYPHVKRAGKYDYLLLDAEVGDSIFAESRKGATHLCSAITYYSTVHNKGWKAQLRKVDNGFRVWIVQS